MQNELIEQIKKVTKIGDLLKHFRVVQSSNDAWLCPFHEDKSPSFVAKPDGNKWKCMNNCGSGDQFDFIERILNLNKLEAINWLADFSGIKQLKKLSLEEVSAILSFLYANLEQSKEHKKLFHDKRGFDLPENYKTFDKAVFELAFKKFGFEVVSLLFNNLDTKEKLFTLLNDRLIIFHRNTDNQIIYYRTYSFTNDKYKKLSPSSHSLITIPYGLEKINEKTIRIIVTEGEEKADLGNYFNFKNTVFLSIPGINNRSLTEYVKLFYHLDIIIIFDKKNRELNIKKNYPEVFSAYSLANELLKLGCNKVKIAELPEPVTESEYDLDSYLLKFTDFDSKKNELIKVLKNQFSISQYEDLYTGILKPVDNKLSKLTLQAYNLQLSILNYLINNNEFIDKFTELLNDNDFIDPTLQNILKFMKNRYITISYCDFDKISDKFGDKIRDSLEVVKYQIKTFDELEEYCGFLKEISYKFSLINFEKNISKIIYDNLEKPSSEIQEVLSTEYNKLLEAREIKSSTIQMSLAILQYFNEDDNTIDHFIRTPHANLNEALGGGLLVGKLHIISGRPSTGKTSFTVQIMEYTSKNQVPTMFYSLETDKTEATQQILARRFKKNIVYFKAKAYDQKEINKDNIELKDFENFYFRDDLFEPDEIVNDIIRKVKTLGIKIVFIDHFHLFQNNHKRFKDERTFYSHWCTRFQRLAKKLDIAIVMLCQLSRTVEGRMSAKPRLSDLKETGNLEQDAYSISFLYAKEKDNQQSAKQVMLFLAKNKGGMVQEIAFDYQREKFTFQESFI